MQDLGMGLFWSNYIHLIDMFLPELSLIHNSVIDARNANRYHLFMSENDHETVPNADADAQARSGDAGRTRRVTSSELLGTNPALVILHNGREYVLRVTQNGKLILTA